MEIVVIPKENLHVFKKCFGLAVNVMKSPICCCNMEHEQREEIQNLMQFSLGNLPVRYLGLLLLITRLRFTDCMPLVDKVTGIIQLLRGKTLSYISCLQLVKAVVNNLASYEIYVYKLPKETTHEVKRLCWNFL